MNQTSVKCFKGYAQVGMRYNIEVFYTVPDFYHTKLFTCLKCGAIFCADQEDIDYSGKPLDVVVGKTICPGCSSELSESMAPYPQLFRLEDGTIGHFEPTRQILDDKVSLAIEFWDLYS